MPDKATVIVIGDEGVGKSALILQLCLSHFPEQHEPTADDCIRKPILVDNTPYIIDIVDTAGKDQNDYMPLTERWLLHGDAFILAFSIASRDSFDHIEKYHEQVRMIKRDRRASGSSSGRTEGNRLGLVLAGLKGDRVGEREVSRQEARELAARFGCEYVEASARRDVGVEDVFVAVVRSLTAQQLTGQQAAMERKGIGRRSGRCLEKMQCIAM